MSKTSNFIILFTLKTILKQVCLVGIKQLNYLKINQKINP